MFYTVFPKDDNYMPQDFETCEEANEYVEELKEDGIESEIYQSEGEMV